jgi:hypothetical protein
VSADWSKPQPDITRAIIILHGRLRNADVRRRPQRRQDAHLCVRARGAVRPARLRRGEVNSA